MAVTSAPEEAPKPSNPGEETYAATGAATPPPLPPSEAGWKRRLSTGAGVALQLFALAIIVFIVNGLAFKHYHRFDYSRDRRTELSQRTRQFLAGLTKPVKIIVFFKMQSEIQADVNNLADEYRLAQPRYVSVEQVDPLRDVGHATDIQNKYKLAQQGNVIIVECEGRNKVIGEDKLAEYDYSEAMTGEAPKLTAFTGEQAITSGLLEVTEGKKSSVYYLQGHGEPGYGSGQPLGTVSSILDFDHVTSAALNLLDVPTVPADASVVLLIGARFDLTEREVKLLEDYWNKGGRLFVLLDPDASTPNLLAFLRKLGVTPDDDRVLTTISMAPTLTALVRDTVTSLTGSTPIATKLPAGLTPMLVGGAQSLTLATEAVAPQGIKLSPLLVANPKFWGETDYKDLENTGAYDDAKDKHAPLYLAATLEKGALGDPHVQVGAARMIVVGASHFAEQGNMEERTEAFFDSGLNWLLEREALIGIESHRVHTFRLALEPQQIGNFAFITMLVMPGAFALLGVLVWWRRRS